MSTIDISELSLQEKFQVMESIWADLNGRVNRMGVPQSHKDLLDSRRQKVESGESKLIEWDLVKHAIGKR